VNRATGKVESWLTDEQAATLTAYAEALSKGAKPSEALAVIGRGPVVAAPQVPGWMPLGDGSRWPRSRSPRILKTTPTTL
jgi:hypothetical protein